jgi:hypothetical protein
MRSLVSFYLVPASPISVLLQKKLCPSIMCCKICLSIVCMGTNYCKNETGWCSNSRLSHQLGNIAEFGWTFDLHKVCSITLFPPRFTLFCSWNLQMHVLLHWWMLAPGFQQTFQEDVLDSLFAGMDIFYRVNIFVAWICLYILVNCIRETYFNLN